MKIIYWIANKIWQFSEVLGDALYANMDGR